MHIQPTPPAPPPSPISGGSHHSIQITTSIEKTYEQIPFDITKPWTLCRVPADQIERWRQIQTQWIFIGRGNYDRTFYHIAVYKEYLPWLHFHKFQCEVDFDPLKPVEAEVQFRGQLQAILNTEERHLFDAISGTISGRGPGFQSIYREILPPQLRGKLEWTSFTYEYEAADLAIRTKFNQNLVLISLAVLNDYNTVPALKLLQKDGHELSDRLRHICKSNNADLHWISILRSVFQFSGGGENILLKCFDSKRPAARNANLCSLFMGIVASKPFGFFDVQKMRDALSKSKVFDTVDISTLKIGTITVQIMGFLSFGHIQRLNLPDTILTKLDIEQKNLLRVQIAHIYHQLPSLARTDNDVLVLLTWSSIDSTVHQVVTEWVLSHDGRGVYERMINDLQSSQTCEQLGLTLASLLCYRRLLPTSQGITRTTRGYLSDFDALLHCKFLNNERATLEQIILSIFRVFETSKDKFRNLRQLLAAIISIDTPVLHHLDGFSDQYWDRRFRYILNYKDTIENLVESIMGLNYEGVDTNDDDWVAVQKV